jgi:hypothetical protein
MQPSKKPRKKARQNWKKYKDFTSEDSSNGHLNINPRSHIKYPLLICPYLCTARLDPFLVSPLCISGLQNLALFFLIALSHPK